MKIIQLLSYVNLFFIFSCQTNEHKNDSSSKKIKYENLNISFGLTTYNDIEYNIYGETLASSRIALSDSVLLIFEYNEFDSLKKTKIKIWIKGKKIASSESFNSLRKMYNLKDISINDFVIDKKDSINTNYCLLNIDVKNKYIRKLKNNLLLSFHKGSIKNDTTINFNICNKLIEENIPINYEIGAPATSFFLHDITGDGIEEVFIGYYLVNSKNNNYSIIIDSVFSFF